MNYRAGTMVTGLVLALAASACAGDAGGTAAGAPVVNPRWTSCAEAGPGPGVDPGGAQEALSLPRLDDSFQPTSAVICLSTQVERPTGGIDVVAAQDRADDVAALVATLRLPDEPRTDGACTADLPGVAWFVLLDAEGRWVRPGVPTDSCGKPRREFRDAFDRLATERVKSDVIGEARSDEAAAAGCGQQWADMVWVTGRLGGGAPGTGPVTLPAGDAEVRVCFYRVPADQRGTGKPGGEFESGTRLAPGTWAQVRRELTAAAPAAACSTPATRFALLYVPNPEVYVEADGCRRAVLPTGDGPSVLRQVTPELTALLSGR